MREFKLLKDTPELKAGAILEQSAGGTAYFYKGSEKYGYHKNTVENNPEWFEEIIKVVPYQPALDNITKLRHNNEFGFIDSLMLQHNFAINLCIAKLESTGYKSVQDMLTQFKQFKI